jgi:molecular chaperone GrpE
MLNQFGDHTLSIDRSTIGKMAEHKKHKIAVEEKTEPDVQAESVASETPQADLLTEVASLREDLESLQSKSQEYLDGWQRERAEFANYKRRVEKEREQAYQNAVGVIVRHYFDVMDDLERALKNRPADGDGAVWAAGVELIYRKLLGALEAEGVQQMDADGQFFDPTRHEAISQEPSPEHESGQIIEVIKNGYVTSDRVLRPALVRIAQ